MSAPGKASAAAWADVPDQDVARLIELARDRGLDLALDAFAVNAPFFVTRLRNLALGNWHVLFTKPRESSVLDVGCGFGALIAGLASSYSRATGLEMLPERLRVAALRKSIALVRGSGHALPLAAGSQDLVTMNGVLEWAAYYADGDPGELQRNFLCEANRVLAPDGTLAVAIENRYALETLLGLPDTHTRLHLVPALPRGVAHVWCRLRGQRGFRTYLYDRAGYAALLHSTGFRQVRLLDLAPSYNDYDFIVDAHSASSYELLWSHDLMRSFYPGSAPIRRRLAAVRPEWLGCINYAYLVVGGDAPTLLEAEHPLWADLARRGFDSGTGRFGADMTAPGSMALLTHTDGRLTGAVFVSRCVRSSAPLEHLRSRRLAERLDGRLCTVAETAHAGWHALACRIEGRTD